jgi:sulfatase maturation enzyme AslB (radical SAM superfamily)
MGLPLAVDPSRAPEIRTSLDTLWFQLTGTLCNIACRHCFITCGPREDRVPMMERARVLGFLGEAEALGVRDYYFTGGEPMLHPDYFELCEATLKQGPLTVLTNGILIDEPAARESRRLFDQSRYSFELRVSLDGMSAEINDPVRGKGTFEQIAGGLRQLAAVSLSPIITVVEHEAGMAAAASRLRFLDFARSLGLSRPRVKFLPLLRIGREAGRTHGYTGDDLDVLFQPLASDERLGCRWGRLATANGVMTCPILLDAPEARLGATLRESLVPIRLAWSACRTCLAEGLSCTT